MEENKYKYKVITIPNILSFFRIALIPVFVWLYSFEDAFFWAMFTLGVSGVTDIVDGFIARTFGMVSNVGRILDPIADKLTQIAVLVCLCFKFPRIAIVVAVLVVKEVVNGIIGLVMMHKNRDAIDSKWHGKLATVCIYFTGVFHLLWPTIPVVLSWILIALCLVTMAYSFVMYTINNVKIIKDFKKEEKENTEE